MARANSWWWLFRRVLVRRNERALRSLEATPAFVFVGIFCLLAICIGTPAGAERPGSLGETSTGSVGISVSISPRIHVSTANVYPAAGLVGTVVAQGNGYLCLQTNMPKGRFEVAVESTDPAQQTSSPVAHDASAAATCAARLPNAEGGALALVLPRDAGVRDGALQLIISPD